MLVAAPHVRERLLERDRRPLRDELVEASAGPHLGPRGEEELHVGVGEDHRPDVAPLEDDSTVPTGLPLHVEQRVAHGLVGRHRARPHPDVGRADGVGDVRMVEANADAALRVPVEAERRPGDEGPCELADAIGVVPRDPRALRRERDGAVHRAGVDEDEAQRLGEASGHVLLPAPAGPSMATMGRVRLTDGL